eukprot:3998431-Amphidinium_carterae.1
MDLVCLQTPDIGASMVDLIPSYQQSCWIVGLIPAIAELLAQWQQQPQQQGQIPCETWVSRSFQLACRKPIDVGDSKVQMDAFAPFCDGIAHYLRFRSFVSTDIQLLRARNRFASVSYTHLRAHETEADL